MGSLINLALLGADYGAEPSAEGGGLILVIYLAVVVLIIAGFWKTFQKAGQPGWAAIVPIYNIYVLLQICGRPGWWVLLYLIPIVGLIVSLIVSLDVAKSFGKEAGFGIGLWLLSPIFYCMLGFGDAQYVGPAAAS